MPNPGVHSYAFASWLSLTCAAACCARIRPLYRARLTILCPQCYRLACPLLQFDAAATTRFDDERDVPLRFHYAGFLIACILALWSSCIALAAQPSVAMQQQTPTAQALAALQARTNHTARVTIHPATGVARFVRLEPASWQPPAPATGATAQAQAFLHEYGLLFGVQDPEQELHLIDAFTDAIGMRHLIYQQQYHGVPVFAGELRLHFNARGELLATNGVFVPDLALDTTPQISAQTARAHALLYIAQQSAVQRQASPAHLATQPGRLYLFRANLARGLPGPNHLVYEVPVSNGQDIRDFVYVDAHTGAIIDQISGLHTAIQRRVYKSTTFLDPAALVWREGDPLPYSDADPSVQTNINTIIEYSEDTYNFFAGLSGGAFLSWNGADGPMNSIYDHLAIACPNANWNGASTNYCLDIITDDLVAHEWAHGYTQSTHDLVYQWQPGALNEAYSDIWGETIDLLNDTASNRPPDSPGARRTDDACSLFTTPGGTDNSKRWLLLEDSRGFGQALRDMWNPGCLGDPGKVSDTNYFCSAGDSGGVHVNSGVANHAYALLVDGGAYNGQTLHGIGLTRAANIYWRAQTIYQTHWIQQTPPPQSPARRSAPPIAWR
jgi:Zn-dependent metalloprotease